MVDPASPPSPSAVAWALGAMAPVSAGKRGYCASAWAISYDSGTTYEPRTVVPSREPNRDAQLASVMAVVGVIDDVRPGTKHLTIYTNQEWIAINYRNRWKKSNGEAGAYAEEAKAIYTLRDNKGISLDIRHSKLDSIGKPLREQASEAAKNKDRALSPQQRMDAESFPRTSDFNRAGGFTAIEPDPEDDY